MCDSIVPMPEVRKKTVMHANVNGTLKVVGLQFECQSPGYAYLILGPYTCTTSQLSLDGTDTTVVHSIWKDIECFVALQSVVILNNRLLKY